MNDDPQPPELTLAEATQLDDARTPTMRLILVMGAILLMILPFVTTFNEFLTRVVESLGWDVFLRDWVVPLEARMIAAVLGLIGISAQVSSSTVYLDQGGYLLPVYISWNCVGWQSFILYALTLLTGIQGPFTRASKFDTVVVGFLGTYLVNLLRIASVAVVAYAFGQLPAVIYHDYGGTLVILVWLFAFWWFSHGWILEPLDGLPQGSPSEPTMREIYHVGARSGRARG